MSGVNELDVINIGDNGVSVVSEGVVKRNSI